MYKLIDYLFSELSEARSSDQIDKKLKTFEQTLATACFVSDDDKSRVQFAVDNVRKSIVGTLLHNKSESFFNNIKGI